MTEETEFLIEYLHCQIRLYLQEINEKYFFGENALWYEFIMDMYPHELQIKVHFGIVGHARQVPLDNIELPKVVIWDSIKLGIEGFIERYVKRE